MGISESFNLPHQEGLWEVLGKEPEGSFEGTGTEVWSGLDFGTKERISSYFSCPYADSMIWFLEFLSLLSLLGLMKQAFLRSSVMVSDLLIYLPGLEEFDLAEHFVMSCNVWIWHQKFGTLRADGRSGVCGQELCWSMAALGSVLVATATSGSASKLLLQAHTSSKRCAVESSWNLLLCPF